MLLEDVPLRLDQLAAAAAEGRADQLVAIAHTLKGASRSFGALEFATQCQELETSAKSGQTDFALAGVAIEALRAEFTRVAEEIVRELHP